MTWTWTRTSCAPGPIGDTPWGKLSQKGMREEREEKERGERRREEREEKRGDEKEVKRSSVKGEK